MSQCLYWQKLFDVPTGNRVDVNEELFAKVHIKQKLHTKTSNYGSLSGHVLV